MLKELNCYIKNYNDSQANFDLGWQYELAGQTGTAVGFYLRSAEKTNDVVKQYENLIRCFICLDKQRDRNDSARVLLQKAIALMPARPEAYFLLSRLCEHTSSWQDSYTYAELGLSFADFDTAPLSTDVGYPGKYGLLFQKGVSAWWVGLCEESCNIMFDLQNNYAMSSTFATAVDRNLDTIGYPSNVKRFIDNIRFKFNDIEIIDKNYSQTYQDMFVLATANGKKHGTYVEIGCAEPFLHNNTALLETKFDWSGVSIDIKRHHVEDFNNKRNNLVFCLDATTIDYSKFFKKTGLSKDIDYLQIDCEPPSRTYDILKMMPFDEYRFAAITFEHDHYVDPTVRNQSREFLKSKGYRLIASDISFNYSDSYEDWWVHPELIAPEIQEHLLDIAPGAKNAREYLFPKPQ